jgi:3-oxoacyl-[acyl-carrier protein] reductase
MDLTIHFCFSILDHPTQLLRLEMIMKLEAKIARVTGSSSGIGAAAARALAREGTPVIAAGRDGKRGRSVVESIRADDRAVDFIAVPLRDERSAWALATGALDIAGRVDILVTNATIGTLGRPR